MALHKITEVDTEQFSVCHNITSKLRTVDAFKSFVKENSDSYKTCVSMMFYCTSLYLSRCNGSQLMFMQQNIHFDIQPLSTFMFLVSHKSGNITICPSFILF
jgi:hypothetical protein